MICTGNTMLFLDLPVDLCSHLKITESHCTISALWHLAKRAARRIWVDSAVCGAGRMTHKGRMLACLGGTARSSDASF